MSQRSLQLLLKQYAPSTTLDSIQEHQRTAVKRHYVCTVCGIEAFETYAPCCGGMIDALHDPRYMVKKRNQDD